MFAKMSNLESNWRSFEGPFYSDLSGRQTGYTNITQSPWRQWQESAHDGGTLLSPWEQLLVTSISRGADDDLDDSRSVICIHLHILDSSLLVEPTKDKDAQWLQTLPYWRAQNTGTSRSHLNWGLLRSTLSSKTCFPVEFRISASTAFFSSPRPCPSRAEMGSTWGSVNW